jgi:hypothetical protein
MIMFLICTLCIYIYVIYSIRKKSEIIMLSWKKIIFLLGNQVKMGNFLLGIVRSKILLVNVLWGRAQPLRSVDNITQGALNIMSALHQVSNNIFNTLLYTVQYIKYALIFIIYDLQAGSCWEVSEKSFINNAQDDLTVFKPMDASSFFTYNLKNFWTFLFRIKLN